MFDITVIGPAVIDVLASPFDMEAVMAGSRDMEQIRLSFGGDALNESVVLARLGKKVRLISKVGDDVAGRRILSYLEENGVPTEGVCIQEGLNTAINIALITKDGDRKFLMDPHSSLRRLALEDVLPAVTGPSAAGIVSFASMFISPLFTIPKMKELFAAVKESGRILAVDMTRPKNGETLEDIRELLPYMDVFVPNDEEIASLTGLSDPVQNVRLLVEAGVGTAVVKTGGEGCLVGWRETVKCSCNGAYGPGTAGSWRRAGASETTEGRVEAGGSVIRIVRVPAVSGIRCVDTTGAGDTFAAGYLSGLCDGLDREDCARMGCAAASCSVEEIGATDGVHSLEQVKERYGRTGKPAFISL